MIEPTKYEPDIAIPPGETIKEMMDEREWSEWELADRMRVPVYVVKEIIQGKRAIVPGWAAALERVFAMPESFWLNLEKNYRLALARLGEPEIAFTYDIPASIDREPTNYSHARDQYGPAKS